MYTGRIVFSQLMDFLPKPEFHECVRRHRSNYRVRSFSCLGPQTSQRYPASLRRISYFDAETGKRFVFLTNHFTLPALTVAQIYKCRWQVGLFYKWIKQHLLDQGLLWHLTERREDPNLDRDPRLCAGGDRQEGVEARSESPPNPANSQHCPFREEPD